MVLLAAGLAALALLLTAAGAFSRARVATIKALGAWIAALAGLSLMALLLLTGRGAVALPGLFLLGPLAWRYWKEHAAVPPERFGPMTRAEALNVLGLAEGATDAEIRDAWVRLMRLAHPDSGGSDWLASRVNQAKDVLLRR